MYGEGRTALRRVTSADVARESEVSRTTVSYVLNGKGQGVISKATHERVEAAAARLGYAPSAAARILRTGHSDLVLCVMPDWPMGTILDQLVDHLARTLTAHNLTLLIQHGRNRQPLAEVLRTVTPRAVVGFTAFSPEEEVAMKQAGIVVVVTARLDDDPHQPDVFAISQIRVGRLQVQHLASRGHRHIGYAFPSDPRLMDFAERRLAGVRYECADLGIDEPKVERFAIDVSAAAAAVRAWRAEDPMITGVAAYNDDLAIAVLAGLRAEGLRVPHDLAVIGVDNIPMARLTAPPLTSVAQAVDQQGEYMASLVLALLDGGWDEPARPKDPLDVIVREST